MHQQRCPESDAAIFPHRAPSVVLLLKAQLESHAIRQFLEQFLELRAGGGGYLERDFCHGCGRAYTPSFELADQVERRGWRVRERDARSGGAAWAATEDGAAVRRRAAAGGVVATSRWDRWRGCATTKDIAAVSASSRLRRGWGGATGGGHRRGFHQEHLIELTPGVGEFGPQTPPRGVLVFARVGLQVLQIAQVDSDLAACAQAQDALLHRGFTQPGNAILTCRAWLLQLAQQLAEGRVLRGRFEHEVFEVFGNEEIAGQRFLDAFGDLCALL